MPSESPENSARIPLPADNIQINFCKNPRCLNYGTPASTEFAQRGGTRSRGATDNYIIVAGAKDYPLLKCSRCGEFPPIKSNLGIKEEVDRISDYLKPREATCPDEQCPNHSIGVRAGKKHYHSFGKTKSGSHRYRCKACGKTFAVGKSTRGHKEPSKNIEIFKLVMNKMPIRRILEVADIGPGTFYAKLDFFHKQCLAFVAHREQKMIDGLVPIDRLYIGVDRQDYVINWIKSSDKRNIVLSAVGSADNRTGYVFGMHLNYDPDCEPQKINKEVRENGDYLAKPPFRRFARLWIGKDYMDLAQKNSSRKVATPQGTLYDDIRATYADSESREDIESFENMTGTMRLPNIGMQVHSEYTLYGHFFFLKKLLKHVGKVRFFLDQESGIRAACLSAFTDEILERRCDAFYVRINKSLTTNERKKRLADAQRDLNRLRDLNELYSYYPDVDLKIEVIKERMRQLTTIGKWQDRWLDHPIPSPSEPEKAVCFLTDFNDYDENHLARLYDKASLHSIDRFMMQVRRRLSLLERPITSSANVNRRWYGYSPYNPVYVVKLLDIFRVFYNYVNPGDDGQTPAMRLGLAKGKIDLEDIIYYKP